MIEFSWWYMVLFIAPFALYFVARIIFTAYFHARRDFLRRYFNNGNAE